MKLSKKLVYALVFAFIIFSLSLFANFVPCQIAPSVPNPQYTWSMCDLNPDSNLDLGIERKYFSYSSSIRDAYLILMIASFVLCFAALTLISRHKKE